MPQWSKTEAASLLHTLRLLRPQIFRRWSFYKGPLLRFIHISLEVMVDSEKGCSKCTKPLLPYPYRKARGRQALISTTGREMLFPPGGILDTHG